MSSPDPMVIDWEFLSHMSDDNRQRIIDWGQRYTDHFGYPPRFTTYAHQMMKGFEWPLQLVRPGQLRLRTTGKPSLYTTSINKGITNVEETR